MSYATLQDMFDRFGEVEIIQISDRKGLGAVDDAAFAQVQKDGDAEIDVYLQSGYQLPLPQVPTVLTRIACDLYRFYLYGSLVPEHVEARYKSAVKLLQAINKGEVNLNPPAQGESVQESSREVHVVAGTVVFTDHSLRNF